MKEGFRFIVGSDVEGLSQRRGVSRVRKGLLIKCDFAQLRDFARNLRDFLFSIYENPDLKFTSNIFNY